MHIYVYVFTYSVFPARGRNNDIAAGLPCTPQKSNTCNHTACTSVKRPLHVFYMPFSVQTLPRLDRKRTISSVRPPSPHNLRRFNRTF